MGIVTHRTTEQIENTFGLLGYRASLHWEVMKYVEFVTGINVNYLHDIPDLDLQVDEYCEWHRGTIGPLASGAECADSARQAVESGLICAHWGYVGDNNGEPVLDDMEQD